MPVKPWEINKPLSNNLDVPSIAPVVTQNVQTQLGMGHSNSPLVTSTVGNGISSVGSQLPMGNVLTDSQNGLVTSNGLNGNAYSSPSNNFSSLGGYGGGYGGMGMGGMGMGGMGMGMGMGMMGYGMGTMSPESFTFKSIRFLESASFLVSNISQATRSIESNTEGIYSLTSSIGGLFVRIRNWIKNGVISFKDAILYLVNRFMVLLRLKKEMDQDILDFADQRTEEEIELEKLKRKERLLSIVIQLLLVFVLIMFIVSNIKKSSFETQNTDITSLSAAFESQNT